MSKETIPTSRWEREKNRVLLDALALHNGNKTRAAEYLGISRPVYFRRMKKYGLDEPGRGKRGGD